MYRQKETTDRSAQPTTKATKDNVLLAATTFPRVACKIKIGHSTDSMEAIGEELKGKGVFGKRGPEWYASKVLNETLRIFSSLKKRNKKKTREC